MSPDKCGAQLPNGWAAVSLSNPLTTFVHIFFVFIFVWFFTSICIYVTPKQSCVHFLFLFIFVWFWHLCVLVFVSFHISKTLNSSKRGLNIRLHIPDRKSTFVFELVFIFVIVFIVVIVFVLAPPIRRMRTCLMTEQLSHTLSLSLAPLQPFSYFHLLDDTILS